MARDYVTGDIPPALGQLHELIHLLLMGNGLSGPIPPELGQLSNLALLGLSNNQLTGAIPAELANLSNLQTLLLGANRLTDYQPGAFSGLVAITVLHVADNQLPQSAVDAIINDIYQDRDLHSMSSKTLDLGGTNAAPGAAALIQVMVLRATYGWDITCNGC